MSEATQSCRHWFGGNKHDYCHAPAIIVAWGKLYPKDELGPRCRDHLPAMTHLDDIDQHAVLDLRPLLDVQDRFDGLMDALEEVHYRWEMLSGAKSPLAQAREMVKLSDAVSDLASWHPGWKDGTMPWEREDEENR